MRIYISGGVTGVDNYWDNFCRAEDWLKQQGFEVLNPVRVNEDLPDSFTWQDYMDIDLEMLRKCDMIVMLPDWTKSRGAKQEYYAAKEYGLEVYSYITLLGRL